MKVMTLHLRHAGGHDRFESLSSFVGEDASGSFGLLPDHAPMMTALVTGLARFRVGTTEWHYLALPGGILAGTGRQLTICTRRYLHDTDVRRMAGLLEEIRRSDREALGGIRESLRRLEEEMLRRLREMERSDRS